MDSAHGFVNIGANCWLNSLLQALLSCPSFVETLVATRPKSELAKTLVEMIEAPLEARPNFAPKVLAAFQAQAQRYGKSLDVYSQEGCQNGFTVLMELLGSTEVNNLAINKWYGTVTCPECAYVSRNESHEFSIQTTKSFCEPMVMGEPARSFNEWLKVHTSTIDEWTCERCRVKTRSVIRLEQIATLRDIIVVMITDRSAETYPETMEFPSIKGNPICYRLIAGISHQGSMNPVTYASAGHYMCYGYRNSRCYLFNDTSVSSVGGIPTPRCNVLIYHRV